MSVQQQVIYRDQFVEGFERRVTVLREAVTTDTESRGGAVNFLIALSGASGGRSAVTRGSNGLIAASDDSQAQVALNFAEAHDLQKRTGFDIFRAQSNQLAIMQMNGMAVINRKIDSVIIASLDSGTVTLGSVGAMSKTVANQLVTKLRNAFAGESDSGNLYAVVTPACFAYLTDITSFANSLYNNGPGGKLEDGIPKIENWTYWMGLNWKAHSGLNGGGTSSATCYAWHKAAVGHAIASGTVDAVIDRNREQDYSYSRHSVYQASAKLQNSGIVKFVHDDSAIS